MEVLTPKLSLYPTESVKQSETYLTTNFDNPISEIVGDRSHNRHR